MHTVRIPALDEVVPALGVGCASVMGRVGRRESLDALAAAYDAGARYFDVARSYGYGNAERVVGEFLHGRRDDCVVVTKVGILPSVPGLVNRVLLPLARRVASRVPAVQSLSSRRGAALSGVAKGNFEPDNVVSSVETSLRELATEGVDLLLLHEVTAEALTEEALLRCLEDIVGGGKARALGIATHVDQSLQILDAADRLPFPIAVVQIPSNLEHPDRARLAATLEDGKASSRPFISTHSSLAVDPTMRERFADWLEAHPDRIASLRSVGMLRRSVRDDLSELLLGWALASNLSGMTLCGMLRRAHVDRNMRVAELVAECSTSFLTLAEDWRESQLTRSA